VRGKALEPVHQRIVAATHLESLQEEETTAYVQHRLKIVGWTGDPELTRRVYAVIYRFSEGVPRRINLICNRLLLNAFVEQRHRITIADAKVVVQELHDEQLSTRDILGDMIFRESDDEPAVVGADTDQPVAMVDYQGGAQTASEVKERARFEALEVSPPAASSDTRNPKKYMGPEQRRGHRRGREDRRKDIRFELDKDDRRKGTGRRRDDKAPDFW
jgi:hypothetical protein